MVLKAKLGQKGGLSNCTCDTAHWDISLVLVLDKQSKFCLGDPGDLISSVTQATGGLSGASLDGIVESLDGLQEAMREWGVAPPAEGWKAWCAGHQNATKDAKAAFEVEGDPSSGLC